MSDGVQAVSAEDKAQVARGRGRPKAVDAASITRTIMAAAADVFLAVGFQDASMEAIAARADITKVTLYRRFSDKRSLLRALLKEKAPEWIVSAPTGTDLETRLKFYAEAILVRGSSPELRRYQMLAVSAWPLPEDMVERDDVLAYRDMVTCLEREIRDGAVDVGIVPDDAGLVATALMSMLSGWYDHAGAKSGWRPAEARAFSHKAVEYIMHGKAAW